MLWRPKGGMAGSSRGARAAMIGKTTAAKTKRSYKCAVKRRATHMEPNIGRELYRVMDALVALKVELSCDPHVPDETLVLSAEKARDACEALETASASIKHLAAALNGGGNGGGNGDRSKY